MNIKYLHPDFFLPWEQPKNPIRYQNSPGAKYRNLSTEKKPPGQIHFGSTINDYKSDYKYTYTEGQGRGDTRALVDEDVKKDHRRHHFSMGMREDFDPVTGGNYNSQTESVYKGGPVGPRTP